MNVVNNKEQFIKAYYYDGGLGGGYTTHHIVYLPKDRIRQKVFLAGYKAGKNVPTT